MKTGGNREQIAYAEAKNKYLAIGKRYSALLTRMMDLDPNVLKIAEEIMFTGDGLSVHDNRFLTSFYNELKAKSKIDKKYYELLLELKKTRTELDNAVSSLSHHRATFLLRKVGIPPKRTNQSKDIIVSQINSSDVSLLEKISLPGVLDVESSESLDELVSSGDLVIDRGSFVPKTKVARDFVRNMEKGIRQKVNDDYLLTGDENLLKRFGKLEPSNLLEFVRISADPEHIREIERRIDAGDISLTSGTLRANTEKGKRYLTLLTEELTAHLHKKVKMYLTTRNAEYSKHDPRLGGVALAMKDLDISLGKHLRLGRLAVGGSYADLLETAKESRAQIKQAFSELMSLQETISAAYADVKKQLLVVVNKEKLDIVKILALLIAVRYLSIYEGKYESKLTLLESLLGLVHGVSTATSGPIAITRLRERYTDRNSNEEVDSMVRNLIVGRLGGRRELGTDTNETLVRFILDSPQIREYRDIIASQQAVRKHIVDTIHGSDCLYQGLGNMSETLAELTELEVEKTEKLADLVHELELAHKEFWLARISNSSQDYINTNFGSLSEDTKRRAISANKESVTAARKEIRETLAKYRQRHQKHSEDFAKVLRASLADLSKGGDISAISAKLKAEYKKMSQNHEALITNMEQDIIALEKRLLTFENNAPSELEKLLISDIRTNI